jgi:hypothetical protein
MPDAKITALTAISVIDVAADVLPIVDISDTSMAASGTTKKITINQILGASGAATFSALTVSGAATAQRFIPSSATVPTNGMYLPAANELGWAINSAEAMRLNSTGLGVGVTPSAWGSNFKSIESGAPSAYVIAAANVNGVQVSSNCYNDNTNWIYKTTGTAARFAVNTNQFQWFNAPSGTAGNTITFTPAMTLDASGNLLVGTTGISWQTVAGFYYFAGSSLNVTRNGDACQLLNRLTSDGIIVDLRRSANSVGNISVTTTGATFNSTSDYRLKESVAPLSGGLSRVNALKPSVYKWKSNGSDGEGFLAHELAEVVPAAVNGEKDAVNEDGTIKAQSIDMSRIVPILVAAIKELTARVQTLEAK